MNIAPTQPPNEEDYRDGKAEKKQCIVRFDYATYQRLIKAYNIEKSCLPSHKNHDSSTQNAPATQQVEVEDYEDSQRTQQSQKRKGRASSSQAKRIRK